MLVSRNERDGYLESSKVDHAVNVGVLAEDLVQGSLVGDVDIVELGALAADELDAIDDFLGGVVDVVDDDDLVTSLEKRQRGEGANVASATVQCKSSCASVVDSGAHVYPVTRTEPTTILKQWIWGEDR